MSESAQTDVEEVRGLARRGLLATTIAGAGGPDRRRLIGATYVIAWPVVYRRLTQRIELRRGHHGCASSVRQLTPDCLDRFEDDVEAVVDDVIRRASAQIHNLEGWIASRLVPATVDGHRQRRGRRGALQRPRVPGWLATELNGDPWLIDLATQILVWVGVRSTAGYDLWPTQSWVVRRCERYGGWTRYGEADAGEDIRTVLRAMNRRPNWYHRYVECPLGRKQAPVVSSAHLDDRGEPRGLALVGTEVAYEQTLTALAHEAVLLIRERVARGEPTRTVVADVLRVVFDADGGVPGTWSPRADRGHDGRLDRVLRDATELDRIATEVMKIVDGEGLPAGR